MPTRTIGKAANEAGVCVETIRYYEKRGLLRRPTGPSRGPRHYDAGAVLTLRFVKRAQSLGFSLAEIKDLLALRENGEAFCREGEIAVNDKILEIEEKIRDLTSMREELLAGKAMCAEAGGGDSCPALGRLSAKEGEDE